jgi:hypothetical protein
MSAQSHVQRLDKTTKKKNNNNSLEDNETEIVVPDNVSQTFIK